MTEPAPYLIRGNPSFSWIPAFAGMTGFAKIKNVTVTHLFYLSVLNIRDSDFVFVSNFGFRVSYFYRSFSLDRSNLSGSTTREVVGLMTTNDALSAGVDAV